jgi:acyl CoA:acetate/3-ketoacid CoA transferase alpha subunit
MSSSSISKKQITGDELLPRSLDELARVVSATKTRFESEEAELARLEKRFASPEADDTPTTLGAIEEQIGKRRLSRNIAKANHERAVTALAEAEKKAAVDGLANERSAYAKRHDEMVSTKPGKIRELSKALIAEAAELHFHDQAVLELNKRLVAAGMQPLPLAEQTMRFVPGTPDREITEEIEVGIPATGSMIRTMGEEMRLERRTVTRKIPGRRPIMPTAFASALTIPGFSPGEPSYRVSRAPATGAVTAQLRGV